MARIGVISIDLIAKTGGLVAPLKTASKSINRFVASTSSLNVSIRTMSAGITSMTGRLTGLVAAMAPAVIAGLSFAAAAAKVREQFGETDEIAKFAARIGISTEALVGLRHGAELSGVSVRQLQLGMQRMTRRISEAAQGGGEAVAAISELGLSASELNLDKPEVALGKVADALSGVSGQSDRVRLAFKLFDSEGVGLVNLLKGGSEGLAEFQKEAEKLGITLSATDAAKIEMANDAMSRLGALITGVARRIAVELAPFIQAAATNFVEFGTTGEGVAGTVRGGIDLVIEGLAGMADAVDFVRDLWAGLKLGVQEFASAAVSGLGLVLMGVEKLAESIVSFLVREFQRAQVMISESLNFLVQKFVGVVSAIDTLAGTDFTGLVSDFSNALNDGVTAARRTFEETDFGVDFKFGENFSEFGKNLRTEVDRANKEFDAFISRKRLGERLRDFVKDARKAADKAAAELSISPDLDLEMPTVSPQDVSTAALDRGSQEAFAAFRRNVKNAEGSEKEAADRDRKKVDLLRRIARNTNLGLGVASL